MSNKVRATGADHRSGHPGRAAAAREVPETAAGGPRPAWKWVAGLAVLLAVVVFVITRSGGDGDDGTDQDPPPTDVARLEEQEAARDVAQVEELTALGREASALVDPVVARLTRLLREPASERGTSSGPRAATSWLRRIAEVERLFGDPESASTGNNVARGALLGSIDAIEGAVRAYDDSGALPPGPLRSAAIHRAVESLDLGIRLWSVAAMQLDQLNVDAGLGHQHIQLHGATLPDGLPEGTDAH